MNSEEYKTVIEAQNSPGYNGWTNYETWAVNLWIDNEPGSQDYARETVLAHSAGYDRAEALKDLVWSGDLFPMPDSGLAADLVNSALHSVNWAEIVSHYEDES